VTLLIIAGLLCVVRFYYWPIIRRETDREICFGILKRITFALGEYCAEAGGVMPSSWEDLVAGGYLPPTSEVLYLCPADQERLRRGVGSPHNTSFELMWGVDVKTYEGDVILHKEPELHGDGYVPPGDIRALWIVDLMTLALLSNRIPKYIGLLRSSRLEERREAIERLRVITGLDFGYDPEADEDARERVTRAWEEWLTYAREEPWPDDWEPYPSQPAQGQPSTQQELPRGHFSER